MAEFAAWPKTPRLFRTIVVTEKIDGTNAAIHIERGTDDTAMNGRANHVLVDGDWYAVSAQSRKRLIYPGADSFGFAAWVFANSEALVRALGVGTHFGEWWGSGIQRGYGLAPGVRRFSLFNTDKWRHLWDNIGGVRVASVPVLYQGEFSETEIKHWLRNLAQFGSVAADGFDRPEGICIWHSQTRSVFKVTLDHNDAGKWEHAAG